MRKCTRTTLCAYCPDRGRCPVSVRKDKRRRRPMACSASSDLMRRAAAVLERGWYTCEGLGTELYGEPSGGKSGRMSVMVRARRPINRMRMLGVLVVRQNDKGVAEYTVTPGWEEVL